MKRIRCTAWLAGLTSLLMFTQAGAEEKVEPGENVSETFFKDLSVFQIHLWDNLSATPVAATGCLSQSFHTVKRQERDE